jgi:indole-3-glycerol phosphate synthase
MTILDQIIANKLIEVSRAKEKQSIAELSKSGFYGRATISLASRLKNGTGTQIITEFKRKSPSKGDINIGAGVQETTTGYAIAGAAGLSILTDTVFFGGFAEDLQIARTHIHETPLLRKDFIIDTYQLHQAKAWGADVVLLIAANLNANQVKELSKAAKELSLEVLLEVHDLEEIQKCSFEHIDIVGVNNRNLKNFAENNVNASLELFEHLPAHLAKISESCIHASQTVKDLQKVGYDGFLIGESFMKTVNPAAAFSEFLKECNA